MNNLEEIKSQSQFDCFAKMYSYIADSLLENGGRRGERVLREALIRYGEDRGLALRLMHTGKGIKTNLLSFSRGENCCGEDPRFYKRILKDTEEVQLWEVYSCPLEHMWRGMGTQKAGMMYCEECIHAMVRTYTEGKGQANLSNLMTCERDNHCRFSLYYRLANLDTEQREQSFGEGEKLLSGSSYDIKDNFIKLYFYLLSSAGELMGQDGISAVLEGMKKLTEDLVQTLKQKAVHVDRSLDNAFFEEFFPLGANVGHEKIWEKYSGNHAKKILLVNLVAPLLKELDLIEGRESDV